MLKLYFKYKYLPQRFICPDNHKKTKSPMEIPNLLYVSSISNVFEKYQHWILLGISNQQINALLFGEPLQQYLMVFTRDNCTKQASSLSMFHSVRQWRVGKTLKMSSKRTRSTNPADHNPKNINIWLLHSCNNSSGNLPPTRHLFHFPISIVN